MVDDIKNKTDRLERLKNLTKNIGVSIFDQFEGVMSGELSDDAVSQALFGGAKLLKSGFKKLAKTKKVKEQLFPTKTQEITPPVESDLEAFEIPEIGSTARMTTPSIYGTEDNTLLMDVLKEIVKNTENTYLALELYTNPTLNKMLEYDEDAKQASKDMRMDLLEEKRERKKVAEGNVDFDTTSIKETLSSIEEDTGKSSLIGGGLGALLGSLLPTLKKNIVKIFKFILRPKNLIKVLGKLALPLTIALSLFEGIKSGFEEYQKTGDIKNAIISGFSGIIDFLTFGLLDSSSIKEVLSSTVGFYTDFLSTGFNMVKDFFVDIWSNISDMIDKVMNVVDGIKISTIDFVKEVADWIPGSSSLIDKLDQEQSRLMDNINKRNNKIIQNELDRQRRQDEKDFSMKSKSPLSWEAMESPSGENLGMLSQKYESGEMGSLAIGFDPKGGTSYGKYQIATRTGTMNRFMNFLEETNPEAYERLSKAGSPDTGKSGKFAQEWRKLASEGKLGESEKEFIKITHFDVAMRGLKNENLKEMISGSRVLQEVMFSTSVQHGPEGASKIFNRVYDEGMDERELIKAVYTKRATQFGSSPQRIQRSVISRLSEEGRRALSMSSKNMDKNPSMKLQTNMSQEPSLPYTTVSKTNSIPQQTNQPVNIQNNNNIRTASLQSANRGSPPQRSSLGTSSRRQSYLNSLN